MTKVPSDLAARVDEIVESHCERMGADERKTLAAKIVDLLEAAVSGERERCVGVCRARADLWGRTSAAGVSAPAGARAEAMFRQNEARYLADSLEVAVETSAEVEADA